MTDFTISDMSLAHLESVFELEKACFSEPWSRKSFEESLKNENIRFFVATDSENRIFGYVGFYYVCDEGYITNVAVSQKYRRQGIAKRLIGKIIDFSLKKGLSFVSLEVRKSNIAGISLYRSLGFKEEGERKNFYSNPKEDAIIMTKHLGFKGERR